MRELTGVQYQCYEQKDSHLIVASKSGRWVGSTEWRKDDGEVMGIGVEKRYRRRGVATTMWTMAHDCGPDPRHSSLDVKGRPALGSLPALIRNRAVNRCAPRVTA